VCPRRIQVERNICACRLRYRVEPVVVSPAIMGPLLLRRFAGRHGKSRRFRNDKCTRARQSSSVRTLVGPIRSAVRLRYAPDAIRKSSARNVRLTGENNITVPRIETIRLGGVRRVQFIGGSRLTFSNARRHFLRDCRRTLVAEFRIYEISTTRPKSFKRFGSSEQSDDIVPPTPLVFIANRIFVLTTSVQV